MAQEYEQLLLKNQLCFPLYACGRKIVSAYTPYLKPLGLTYTQYVVLMVLWEKESVNVGQLGSTLHLDAGTLTPLLKRFEKDGYITRERSKEDERILLVRLTDKGRELEKDAIRVPKQMRACVRLSQEEAETLYRLLYKLLRPDLVSREDADCGCPEN